jgi:hypothetical protein
MKEQTRKYPEIGEVFELTLDGDAPENQPLAIAREAPGFSEGDWRHIGKTIKGIQTRKFMLNRLDEDCYDLDELRQKLAARGKTPEGQWLKAFKAKYPYPDRDGPVGAKAIVGVADPSWVSPNGIVFLPCVRTDDGCLSLISTPSVFLEGERWLVEVEEPTQQANQSADEAKQQ